MNTAGYAATATLTTSSTPPGPQITAAVAALRDAQDRADKYLGHLTERMSGVVLHPQPGIEGAELKGVGMPPCSPFAEELWTAVTHLNDLADRLASLGDRIDL